MDGTKYVPVAGSIGTGCRTPHTPESGNIYLMSFRQLCERNRRIAESMKK
ncbi:ParB-like partition protein [Porphyromonas phage phage019b_ATCC49417]|uniref:Uncharacterized protein n=2 Tax=root TaxID=1 RepID=A0AAE9XH14_PORGN|nr:hypothetical protein [Porphyromonas gingivalis]WCG02160.1 hypothetical protein NY151_05590 [Porphyromonas gingivalis]